MAMIFVFTLLIAHLKASTIYLPAEAEGPYENDNTKVNGPFITCWEQNKYTYGGYHDPEYRDNDDFPQYTEGDVCDHTSPTTDPPNQFVRNVCKIEVRIGDCQTGTEFNGNGGGACTRTWSRKCAVDTDDNGSDCPVGWKDAADGCVTTTQGSIVCCCAEDFCNTYMEQALLGWQDATTACQVDAAGGCLGERNVKDEADEQQQQEQQEQEQYAAPPPAGDNEDANVDSVKYTITVVRAEDLEDEDADILWWTRTSDPYVEIYGYVNDGDDYKKFQTSVKDETLNPEWNEEFVFDEADCGGDDDRYSKFIFKVYDDDSLTESISIFEADFLGETRPFYAESVTDCESIYSEDMTLYRDEKESGTLFVEVKKDGCTSGSGYDGTLSEAEGDKDEVVKEKGKNKRRLLN